VRAPLLCKPPPPKKNKHLKAEFVHMTSYSERHEEQRELKRQDGIEQLKNFSQTRAALTELLQTALSAVAHDFTNKTLYEAADSCSKAQGIFLDLAYFKKAEGPDMPTPTELAKNGAKGDISKKQNVGASGAFHQTMGIVGGTGFAILSYLDPKEMLRAAASVSQQFNEEAAQTLELQFTTTFPNFR
jgi:hypothetical protein